MLNDDKNKISLHVQLREQLAEKITSGEWSLGDKIPTERQLCDLELIMNGGFSPLEGKCDCSFSDSNDLSL